MTFELNDDVKIRRNAAGRISQLQHVDAPYRPDSAGLRLAAPAPLTPRDLANEYVRDVLGLFGVDENLASGLESVTANNPTEDGEQLRYATQKSVAGNATVSYVQTVFGIPVWRSGLSVQMEESPMQVIGSRSTMQQDVNPAKPSEDAQYMPDAMTPQKLAGILDLNDATSDTLKINRVGRLFVYRYDRAQRLLPNIPTTPEETGFQVTPPVISVPDVAASIEDGRDYIVSEMLFSLSTIQAPEMNWMALIEVETGSVLYLRPLVSCLSDGLVYEVDPVTRTGNPANTPAASDVILDSFRQRVTLQGLTPAVVGQNQELRGEFVRMTNITPPAIQPPSVTPPAAFDYAVNSNDFSAVNAYHNCDRLFRLVQDLGINVHSYFNGTTFPVRVDHRCTFNGQSNVINAQAPGNSQSNGSDGFRFALARLNSDIGLANDWRVVLHEFGHAILWDHVDSPNFGFAHSAGDALAAILNDPENLAERGRTFPWVASIINRRHDRTVEAGWGFYGVRYEPFDPFGQDSAGYLAEQMLSSTMFRIYLAAGGDSPDLQDRQFASRYVAFLIFKAVGILSPITNAETPEDFADTLIQADTGTFVFQGNSELCGTLSKVIRWSFERQGAYQPVGTVLPVTQRGAPPDVDVFIDDGRGGEYQYVAGNPESPDIWCRQASDNGTVHQTPLRNANNFIYFRIKNRGTQSAQNVTARVYRSVEPDPVWPTDFEELTPLVQNIATSIAPDSEVTAGPFTWLPAANQETLFAVVNSSGDLAHSSRFTSVKPIAASRLIRTDNNLAQRVLNIP